MEAYKTANVPKLKLLSVLIDLHRTYNFKLPAFRSICRIAKSGVCFGPRVARLTRDCRDLGLAFGSVKTHLDAARHMLLHRI